MALTQCPHCQKPMSDKAAKCPHCGKDPQAPIEKKPMVETKQPAHLPHPPKTAPLTESQPKKEQNTPVSAKEKSKMPSWLLWVIIAGLILMAGGVAFWFYYNNVYLPEKRDAEAPRYYVMAQNLNMRSTPEFEAEYNKIASFPYGTEIIVYDSLKTGIKPYLYGKYAPVDAKGKVMKDKVVEGYLSYSFMANKADFFLLNSIFGNEDARKMLSEARYKKALLNYFKQNHFRGNLSAEQIREYGISNNLSNAERWQVFCRYEKAKSNNVYRSKKFRKDSLKNIDSGERRLLYFVFDDDESFRLIVEQPAPSNGYMKDRTLKLKQSDFGSYSVEVEYESEDF